MVTGCSGGLEGGGGGGGAVLVGTGPLSDGGLSWFTGTGPPGAGTVPCCCAAGTSSGGAGVTPVAPAVVVSVLPRWVPSSATIQRSAILEPSSVLNSETKSPPPDTGRLAVNAPVIDPSGLANAPWTSPSWNAPLMEAPLSALTRKELPVSPPLKNADVFAPSHAYAHTFFPSVTIATRDLGTVHPAYVGAVPVGTRFGRGRVLLGRGIFLGLHHRGEGQPDRQQRGDRDEADGAADPAHAIASGATSIASVIRS